MSETQDVRGVYQAAERGTEGPLAFLADFRRVDIDLTPNINRFLE